jgi:aryl-alcohol dehydrogenase-like predicted oxidoreductase
MSSTSSTRRPLGATGLDVHPLCLGGNTFGWTTDDEASFAVLDAYRAAGGNFVDTADVYSAWVDGHEGGESERVLGRWLADRGAREDVVLATKVGMLGSGLGAEEVRTRVHDCLERLGVERIDLLYAHKDDEDTPLEETLEAFDGLVREGLVAHLGASNYTADRLRAARELQAERGWAAYEVVQPGYSLLDRDRYEGALQDLCVQQGLGVAPYAALASGFLTGKYTRGEAASGARGPMVGKFADDDAAWAAVDAVEALAEEHDTTPAAIAVAWVAGQRGVTAPIASATSPEQLEALVEGATLELGGEELERLRAAAEGRG